MESHLLNSSSNPSKISLVCQVCLKEKNTYVDFCGQDICKDCLREHQKICVWAKEKIERPATLVRKGRNR